MRILLAHNSTYYPAHGGGDKSNRLLMEALARRGHDCRVVARTEQVGPEQQDKLIGELEERSIALDRVENGAVVFCLGGVEVHAAANIPNVRAYFSEQVNSFRPDVIITSTDDPAHLLYDVALRSDARVVYLVRATIAVPFGPDSAFPSVAKTEAIRQADGVVGVSHYVAGYVRKWTGIDAIHVPISLQDPGPYPLLGKFDNEFITMVNPCAVKGIAIFVALADAFPNLKFAAVPTWGTSDEDIAELRARPNIEVLPPVENIDKLLARTRIMLVPSVWAEARSRMVVESMLRGIPVMAADVGGLSEAMMGLEYLLPVRPVERYHAKVDKNMVPVAEVPPQDIGPWRAAVEKLTSDRAHWEDLGARSRATSADYVLKANVGPFESYLEDLLARPKKVVERVVPRSPSLEHLSPEKRKLLAVRLRKQAMAHPPAANASPWFPFPASAPGSRLTMLCFPYAGAGASVYRPWIREFEGEGAVVCPARFPGRETRMNEAPVTDMKVLIDALLREMQPLIHQRYALYGHSMGAVIAFELARALRKADRRMPDALIVSGARAPQFRLNYVPAPEPTDAEFLQDIEAREGTPREVLDNPELLKLILPVLKADARLYRNYVYVPGSPLDVPIVAFGGVDDTNVTQQHVSAWREQTTRDFRCHMIQGGHFFIQEPEFLELLGRELRRLST